MVQALCRGRGPGASANRAAKHPPDDTAPASHSRCDFVGVIINVTFFILVFVVNVIFIVVAIAWFLVAKQRIRAAQRIGSRHAAHAAATPSGRKRCARK